ncbi:DUF4865 family protein [Streptomyces sp. B1I3]|uniref:DUF4865 family protein n=1 Tax=Streptomyces sp. B1I3 TaxID=3042264 RepID=UPI00277E1205|nr:DUF4865 family protein [Streptomyces sp. B1I3]MDQ0797920.1 hypothetical protein [Streptomyces sp. B1I3]
MHAMQYEITLPADYDMEIIRRRIATRGHLLDDFPGLGLKAFLIRERGETSPVDQYAPLYLWSAPEGMNAFLRCPGFQGIVDDFGRPQVQHWSGLSYLEGPSADAVPRTALRHRVRIEDSVRPAEAVEAALAEHRGTAASPGAVAAALALDPRLWELLHFTLWEHEPPGPVPGDRYEVLHLSAPERARLARTGQW